MTPISDYIAQAGGIEAAHAALASNPNRRFMHLINRCSTPADLQKWVDGSGFQYVEEVLAHIDGMNALLPPAPFQTVWPDTRVFNPDLLDRFEALYAGSGGRVVMHPDFHLITGDAEYGLLPKANIDWLAANRPSRFRDFPGNTPTHDCEDSCDLDRGWLKAQGPFNGAIGTLFAKLDYFGNITTYHAFMCLIDTTGKIWFLDNSNRQQLQVHDPYALIQFGGFIEKLSVFEMIF